MTTPINMLPRFKFDDNGQPVEDADGAWHRFAVIPLNLEVARFSIRQRPRYDESLKVVRWGIVPNPAGEWMRVTDVRQAIINRSKPQPLERIARDELIDAADGRRFRMLWHLMIAAESGDDVATNILSSSAPREAAKTLDEFREACDKLVALANAEHWEPK